MEERCRAKPPRVRSGQNTSSPELRGPSTQLLLNKFPIKKLTITLFLLTVKEDTHGNTPNILRQHPGSNSNISAQHPTPRVSKLPLTYDAEDPVRFKNFRRWWQPSQSTAISENFIKPNAFGPFSPTDPPGPHGPRGAPGPRPARPQKGVRAPQVRPGKKSYEAPSYDFWRLRFFASGPPIIENA